MKEVEHLAAKESRAKTNIGPIGWTQVLLPPNTLFFLLLTSNGIIKDPVEGWMDGLSTDVGEQVRPLCRPVNFFRGKLGKSFVLWSCFEHGGFVTLEQERDKKTVHTNLGELFTV